MGIPQKVSRMTPDSQPHPDALMEHLRSLGAPPWYLEALGHTPTSRYLQTRTGHRMHCVSWNDSDTHKPALLFVHGYRANTHAWDAIAPFFTSQYRVLAVDLMGMGQSDHLAHYGRTADFAAELITAVDQGAQAPVTLVGHSFGGACGIHFTANQPDRVKQLVLIDTMVEFPELDQGREHPKAGNPRPYPDRASILGRYRLLPPQPCPAWSLAYMAHHSIKAVDQGWTWRFDTDLPSGGMDFSTQEALPRLAVPTHYVCGAKSAIYTPQRMDLIAQTIGQGREAIVIPEAYHHIMLDQPLALIAVLRALLA